MIDMPTLNDKLYLIINYTLNDKWIYWMINYIEW